MALSRQIPLATRNKRDFESFAKASALNLRLVDWDRPGKATHPLIVPADYDE